MKRRTAVLVDVASVPDWVLMFGAEKWRDRVPADSSPRPMDAEAFRLWQAAKAEWLREHAPSLTWSERGAERARRFPVVDRPGGWKVKR